MIALLAIAIGVLAAILEGWVLSIMWGWFIVPVFAAPALRIPYAIGIAMLVGMLTHQTRKDEDRPDVPTILANGLVNPFVFLGAGWLVKAFV